MSDWTPKNLGQLIKVKHGYAFKGEEFTDSPSKYVVVTPGNFSIGGGFNKKKLKFYKGDNPPSNYTFKAGDIIVTMTDLSQEGDSLGYSAKIPHDDKTYLHNQRIGLVEFTSKEAYPDFLYWLMRSREYQSFIVGAASGTSIRHTSPTSITEYFFKLPLLSEQKDIAAVLTSLDTKADLLLRNNQTLTKMAETLYRYWFAEGEDSLETDTIYEYLSVENGYPFNSKLFNESNQGMPLIRIRNLDTSGSTTYTTEEYDSKFIVKTGDLLAGMDGEFRIHIWSGPESLLNQRICRFKPAGSIPAFLVYCMMKPHLEYYEQTKVGTTVIHLSKTDLDDIRVKKHNRDRIVEFGAISDPWYKKYINNVNQIRILEVLRDGLLSKLVKGEVYIQN